MGDAAGEAAHRLHLLRLAQQLLAPVEVFLLVVAEGRVAEGDGDPVLEGHDLVLHPPRGQVRQRDRDFLLQGLPRLHHRHRALEERGQRDARPQLTQPARDDLVARPAEQALGVEVELRDREVGHVPAAVAHGGEDRHGVEAAFDGRPEARVAAAEGHFRPLARDGVAQGAREEGGVDVPLDDVVLRAALEGVRGQRAVVRRHDHHGHVGMAGDHAIHGLEPRGVREAQVQQDGLDASAVQAIERRGQVVDDRDLPRHVRVVEHHADDGREIGLVLDHEELTHGGRQGRCGHGERCCRNSIRFTIL